MAYASWSVVFGEQPSAAKWNILGTNDASFNDGTGIGNDVIGSSQLLAALSNATPGTLADLTTTPTAAASLSITAGTWFIFGKGYSNSSTTVRVTITARLQNTTDATLLDVTSGESEFVSGTLNAVVPFSCAAIATFASTKTVEFQWDGSDTIGTVSANSVKMFAIPVGV